MSKRLLKSLLLKSAFIQKKIDDVQKAKSQDWILLMRLQKLRLKISERIYQLTCDLMMPSPQTVLIPVRVKSRR